MGEFLSKVENFLFDILGLVLPGLVFIAVIIFPIYFLDLSKIPECDINSSYILSGLVTTSRLLQNKWQTDADLVITLYLVLAYLIGHSVKVFSIITYEFLSAIFDKSLNKLVNNLIELTKPIRRFFVTRIPNIYNPIKTLLMPFKNTLSKIFTFESSDYMKENESLKTNCIEKINQKLGTTYPDKWYSVYKFSAIISSQGKVKSLADHFLAKYNLYRSLSFIFAFTTVYYYYLFNETSKFIPPELSKITTPILAISGFLWFTFNYKYKRYWTLCGNERLVSLYYFLNKDKLNEPR
jgi:hypothetical protein